MNSKSALLVDGPALAYVTYHGYKKADGGGLRNASGVPTSVCYGFLQKLCGLIRNNKPACLVVAFDSAATWRAKVFSGYKADRPEPEQDFLDDCKNLRYLLHELNIPVLEVEGYEADDVLATLAHHQPDDVTSVIVTGDRDLYQCIKPNVKVLMLRSGNLMGIDEVKQEMGIYPHQVVSYKALAGDKSDRISGVKGIGEKIATDLLQEYDSVATIYQSLGENSKHYSKLHAGLEDARLSYKLAQAITSVPEVETLEHYPLNLNVSEGAIALLEELNLSKVAENIKSLQRPIPSTPDSSPAPEDEPVQVMVTPTPGTPPSADFTAIDNIPVQVGDLVTWLEAPPGKVAFMSTGSHVKEVLPDGMIRIGWIRHPIPTRECAWHTTLDNNVQFARFYR